MTKECVESYYMFRCSTCGKWSHAKRKPKHHLRFVPNLPNLLDAKTYAESLELEIQSTVEPFWNGDPEGDYNPGGAYVKCGPFETFIALDSETFVHSTLPCRVVVKNS